MENIIVHINRQKSGELFFEEKKKEYGYNYTQETPAISLTMPYRKTTYTWKYHLHPIFEMNLPEGYLFEVFKNYLNKEYGYINDFLIFSYLCPNIESRLTFESTFEKKFFEGVDMDEILNNDSEDTFLKLLKMYLGKNAISGIQPKTLALVREKESISLKEYIVKTWGEEYPYLAENEYFCMMAVEKAGVKIPHIKLSKNKRFLLVERFNFDKNSGEYLGFEEVLVLLGKNRDQKYSGSYEQIAKIIYAVSTDKVYSMEQFYKTVVMSYLLKNGDAHLKNFGILYDNQFQNINFAPAYDVVNTTAYIHRDKPALTMFGKKVWWGKNELVRFGVEHCFLSQNRALYCYEECLNALLSIKDELSEYIEKNISFRIVGNRMIDSWESSIKGNTHKEISVETIRNWQKNKRS